MGNHGKIKVRIALAVDPNTLEWNSAGWGGQEDNPSDKQKMDMAVELIDEGERQYWIEAEIDVKPIETIQAAVKEEIK